MVFRYFPLFIILISLWLFLRTIKFCFANFLFLVPFLSLLCCLASAFPFLWGWPQPACWVSVTGPETPATLPMVLVTLTLRTPYRISLVLPIACCSFCAPFVCLPPFYPMICSVVICTLLEGFPLPLSGFPLSNHRRFRLRQLADRPLSSNWGILLECRATKPVLPKTILPLCSLPHSTTKGTQSWMSPLLGHLEVPIFSLHLNFAASV